MAQLETDLVRMIDATADRAATLRIEPAAAFISQLIAEREHLPAQRTRRRAPVGTAIAAYRTGERSDTPRLPQGFFRTTEA